MLHTDEWLHLAKQQAVGYSNRYRHGAESRRNLVVYNNNDSWSCWCHSCQEGGYVPKEFVVLNQAPPEPQHPIWNPKLVPLSEAREISKIVQFLNSKHMMIPYLPNPKWDTERHRIVLEFPEQRVGRSISNSDAKWLKYTGEVDHVKLDYSEDKDFILTEDLFSALKVRYATASRFNVVALMGTKLDSTLEPLLVQGKKVNLMLDADEAGRSGAVKIKRRLSLYGKDVEVINIPDGLDPKDLTLNEIRRALWM